MSNQLEKLKNSIKKDYTKLFELDLMKTSGFIPVDKRQNEFWVILNQNNLTNKTEIGSLIANRFEGYPSRFIPVDSKSFEELINYVSQTIVESTKEEAENSSAELTAEQMLVSIGWITKEQLNESLIEADEKKLPLDAIFYKKNYLSIVL